MSQPDQLQARIDAVVHDSIRLPQRHRNQMASTASNCRAMRRARSRDEVIARLGIASEAADESVLWLRRSIKADDSSVELGALLSKAEQLARLLGVSHRAARKGTRL